MANIQIPNLPAATSLNGTEQLEAVQSGTSTKVTTAQIATYVSSTYPAPGVSQINTTSPIVGGPITSTGTISLASSGVSNSYLAQMANGTIKANISGSTANPSDVTPSAVLDTISSATGSLLVRDVSSWQGLTPGLNSYVLTSNGAGNAPSWQQVPSSGLAPTGVTAGTYGTVSAVPQFTVNAAGQLTYAANLAISISYTQVTGLGSMATQNANNVTISGGTLDNVTIGSGTPGNGTFATLFASNLSLGNPLDVSYGGTGKTTLTSNGVVYGNGTSALGVTAAGTNNQVLLGNTSAAPSWGQVNLAGSVTGVLPAPNGGTGFSSYTTGDILYADTSSTLARLNDVATGSALISGGVGVAPSWGKIGLTTHVSGTLPVANGGSGATTLSGWLFGNGTSAFTAFATIPNSGLTNSSVTVGSTNIALGGTSTTLAGLTTVTLTQDPTLALQATTKQYVDGQVASVSNTTFHTQSGYATTADLGTVTYNNGSSGVGATITNAGTQAALTIDGYTFTATDVTNATRVLVKNQSSGLQNGIYVVTDQGSVSTNWVLTRATDFNTVGSGPNFVETGASTFVTAGAANGSTGWVMNTTGTITIGTTSLDWIQSSSSASVSVTSPLTKVGSVISLGTVTVPYGGTGLTTLTQYGVMLGNGTGNVAFASPGTTGYPLLSNGASANPSFGQLSLTAGVTGTLPIANGGTGTATAFTSGSVVFAGASGVYSQNNSKFFWDNTNIRLGINTSSPNTNLTLVSNTQTATPVSAASLPAGTDLYILGADAANTRITQDAYGTGNYPAYTGRSARNTAASPTASQTDDILVEVTGRGYGTTGFSTQSVVRIDMEAAEAFTDTAQGTYISLHTSALGTTSPTERFRIGPSGQLGIGGATYGTSGYVLTSGGASAAPTWSQVSLSTGVTGTLPATNGGTGQSSYAVGDLLYANTTTSLAKLADVATGNVLLSGGVSTAPSWGKVDLTSAVSNTLPVSSGGTGQSSALTLNGLVYASSTSAMATTAAGTTGQVLIGNTGAAPSWSSSLPSGFAVTSISFGSTGLTPNSSTTGAVTVAGTLATGSGGTGLTSFTANGAVYATSASALTTGTLPVASGGTGITSFGTGVATALGQNVTGSGGIVLATSPTLTTPSLGVATATSLAVNGATIGTNALAVTGTVAVSSTLTSAAQTITSASANALAVGPSGATNPSLNVDASTASAATGLKIKSAAAAGGLAVSVISSGTNENLTIDAKGSGTVAINGTATGNVGIGTSSPGYKLDINGITGWGANQTAPIANIVGANAPTNGGGNLRVLSNTSATADAGGSLVLGGYYTAQTNSIDFAEISGRKQTGQTTGGYLALSTRADLGNQTERMRIDSSGNVYVNNTTDTGSGEKFQVKGATLGTTAGNTSINSAFYTPDTSNTTRLLVQDYRVSNGSSHTSSRNLIQRRVDTTNMGYVGFDSSATSIGWGTTEAMRIDSSGNVGIGTSSPSQKLSVAGTVESTSGGFKFPDGTTQTTAATAGIPSCTVMLFQQTAAPTGWTKKTCYNDVGLRIVSGAASAVTAQSAFSTVFGTCKSTGATTLSTAQIPSHTHSVSQGGGTAANGCGCQNAAGRSSQTTSSTGGGGSHTHTVTLSLNYVDLILARKN